MSMNESRLEVDGEQGSRVGEGARWHRPEAEPLRSLGRSVALASCIFAVLLGTLFALSSLPARRPSASLVALYLPPPDQLAVGIDGPHPPTADSLFGLVNKSKPSKPAGRDESTSDWRTALSALGRKDTLVFHVAAMAQVEHGQVFLLGRGQGGSATQTVSFREVLTELGHCPAGQKLLILELHWPIRADGDDCSERLQRLNCMIESQLERHPDSSRCVLLASDGEGAARGLAGERRSVLSFFLSAALASDDADRDHDGRITVDEAVEWARPRIQAATSRLGAAQTIRLAQSGVDIALPRPPAELETPIQLLPDVPSQVVAQPKVTLDAASGSAAVPGAQLPTQASSQVDEVSTEKDYPTELQRGWEAREQYLRAVDLPWMPEVYQSWGRQLAQLEARWRRGESTPSVRYATREVEADFTARIEQALEDRRRERSDSLLFAADRFALQENSHLDAAYEVLWEAYQSVPAMATTEVQTAKLDPAIATYMKSFAPHDQAVGLAKTLRPLQESSELDRRRIQLVDKVRQAWNATPQFPITAAIERLASAPPHGDEGTQARRAAQILQLYLHQDRLGGRRTATAVIRPWMERVTRKLADVQRLIWNSGMASEEVVEESLRSALDQAATAFDAELTIAEAIRRIEHVTLSLQLDESLGVQWISPGELTQLHRLSTKTANALSKLSHAVRSVPMLGTEELSVVRQSSQSLQRYWQSLLEAAEDRLQSDPHTLHAGLPTAWCADVRAAVLRGIDGSGGVDIDEHGWQAHPDEVAAVSAIHSTDRVGEWPFHARGDDISSAWRKALGDSTAEYRRWWLTFIGSSRTIEAIPIYRRIAERHSLAGQTKPIPLQIQGEPTLLSWSSPTTTVMLRHLVDVADAPSLEFEFLPPVTGNLRIEPLKGVLRPDGVQPVRLQLRNVSAGTERGTVEGVWLRVRRGEQSQLLPLRISSQPVRPRVEVDFGSIGAKAGGDVDLALWPNEKPRRLPWQVKANDESLQTVMAYLQSESGASLSSAPISVTSERPAPIRFLPPTPPQQPANGTTPKLEGTLTLVIADPKGEELGRWRIATRLRDPRQAIRLGEATYVRRHDGTNALTVEVALTDEFASRDSADGYQPHIRLGLQPQHIDSLIAVERSHLQTQLSREQPIARLGAENLRVREGASVLATIPLAIDGDEGIYQLRARLPRRAGTVGLGWEREPSIAIEAPAAIVPGAPLEATVQARHLDDAHRLVVECLEREPSNQRLWRTELATSRQPHVQFDVAKDGTLEVTAIRRDWKVSIPTDFGTGEYRLRVSTTEAVGNTPISAQRNLLIDDRVPDRIHVRAEIHPRRTAVIASLQPGPSGVAKLALRAASALDPAKPITVTAEPVDEQGAHWRADWPRDASLPEQMVVSLVTGAGKPMEATCEVARQTIVPTARIAGQVREGAIPQPGLPVLVRKPDGSAVGSTKTGSDGRYEIDVPPGRYLIHSEKSVTGRSATATLELRAEQSVQADLALLKPSR